MNLNTIKHLLSSPLRIVPMLGAKGMLNWMPDKMYLGIVAREELGYKVDFSCPRTLNEKLQWLKLYDRDPMYTQLADKYGVRSFIGEKVGEKYLIPLAGGPWDRAEDIDFDALPDEFVLKTTHDSGGVIVCRDKENFDREAAKEKIALKLKTNYFWGNREWPYKDIKPKVIAERLLKNSDGSALADYKFYCYGGKLRYFMVSYGEAEHNVRNHKFDMQGNSIDHLFKKTPAISAEDIILPDNLGEMKAVAQKLCEGFQHIRIDLYNVDGKIYTGEMTFFSGGGFINILSEEYSDSLAEMIDIEKIKNKAGVQK